MLMKHFLPILLLSGFFGAQAQRGGGPAFVPDTTVNGVLELLNPRSIEKGIGDQMKWVVEGSEAARVLLANGDRTEYGLRRRVGYG